MGKQIRLGEAKPFVYFEKRIMFSGKVVVRNNICEFVGS